MARGVGQAVVAARTATTPIVPVQAAFSVMAMREVLAARISLTLDTPSAPRSPRHGCAVTGLHRARCYAAGAPTLPNTGATVNAGAVVVVGRRTTSSLVIRPCPRSWVSAVPLNPR